jgi:hypothetical protein
VASIAAVVVVVLVVAGVLVVGSRGDVSDSSPSTDSLEDFDDVRAADETVPSTTGPTTPPTAVVTPVTSSAPETTTAPATTPPTVQTTVPAPAPPAPQPVGFPFASAFQIPQLGYEPVRGTGCGGDGSIGDVVPDGWWFGGVESITSSSLLLDLTCIFFGEEARTRVAECAAVSGYDQCTSGWSEDFWPVNNTIRYRVVPVDPALVRVVDSTLGCSLEDVDRFERDELSVVHIVGGRAVHLQHLCPGG